MVFDANSLYPSAVYDDQSVYPKTETSFAYKPHMNDVNVEVFNNQSIIEDGDESAIIKTKFYKPRELIFQHLPVKEKV